MIHHTQVNLDEKLYEEKHSAFEDIIHLHHMYT